MKAKKADQARGLAEKATNAAGLQLDRRLDALISNRSDVDTMMTGR